MLQKIVCRIAGVSPGMRLHSTAVERVYISTDFFVCLAANCNRYDCVTPQFFVTKNHRSFPPCFAKSLVNN
ncbi:MAG: hypothetical protein LBP59_04145 [Planctomycetaceae bacterium]|nr:hypothetical protein [Planctomycetaceae bacterium]